MKEGRRSSSNRQSSKSSKSIGDSNSESHIFMQEASEASHHTEKESEEALGEYEADRRPPGTNKGSEELSRESEKTLKGCDKEDMEESVDGCEAAKDVS